MASIDKELKGESREKKYVPPFNTRCSPRKFKELAEFVKGDKRLKQRVEKIGFGQLLNIECKKIPRDLCLELLRAYDPPTKRLMIRGKIVKVNPKDVEILLGLRNKGLKVRGDGNDDKLEAMKRNYCPVPYSEILKKIMTGEEDEKFEFNFILYTLGTFLCPTGSANVSDRLLRVMASTENKWEKYDWATFVLHELTSEVERYKMVRKGKACEAKNVGGCIYFLLVLMFIFP